MTKPAAFMLCFALLGCAMSEATPQSAQAQTAPPQKSMPASDASAPKKRQRVVPNWSGFDLLEKKGERPATAVAGVVGATRGLPQPVALAPRLGKVYTANPVFAWSHEGKSDKFVWILTDSDQTEVFRQEVTGRQFKYPAAAPPLEPGKTYFWTVQPAFSVLGATPSAPAGFIVVSLAQRQEIETALAQITSTDPLERDLARARVFTEHRLWYDAVDTCTKLIALQPNLPEAYELRANILAQLGTTASQAEADFERASQLRINERKP